MLKHLPVKKLILAGGDALLVVTSFYICYAIRHGELIDVYYRHAGPLTLSVFIFIFVFHIADIYNIEGKFYSINNINKLAITIIVANSLIAISFYVFSLWQFSRAVFLLNIIFLFYFLLAWRYIMQLFYKYRIMPTRILIVGAGKSGRVLSSILEGNDNFEIIGYLDDNEKKMGISVGSSTVIGSTTLLQSLVKDKNIDEVIVAIANAKSPELFKSLMNIKFKGVDVHDMPAFYEMISAKIPIFCLRDSWFGYAAFHGIRRNIYNTRIKKTIDKLIAIFGIVASFPIMLVASIAIKIGSRGPVFFKQERVGENAKIFKVYKFRTMKDGKEHERTLAGSKNDPRITRVGKALRFFRIDEIPQLWNVIRGEMSIIGPRSLIKEEVNEFLEKVPYFDLRHSIKPGITGWAQIHYGHGKEVEDGIEKFQYDLYYIKNLSPVLDLQILLETIKVTLCGKGAR